MFRDKEEELKRLEAQLLEEEDVPQTQETAEDILDDEQLDALLNGTDQGENPRVYRNYSNDYGNELRNYASGYKVYNTDTADIDLESYSEEVQAPKPRSGGTWFILLILLLMAAVTGALLWIYLQMGGMPG